MICSRNISWHFTLTITWTMCFPCEFYYEYFSSFRIYRGIQVFCDSHASYIFLEILVFYHNPQKLILYLFSHADISDLLSLIFYFMRVYSFLFLAQSFLSYFIFLTEQTLHLFFFLYIMFVFCFFAF